VRDKVTIAYRGAKYELGRGPTFFGIWPAGASRSQPLQWWPDTPEGWAASWSRFTDIETPGTIVPADARTAGQGAVPAGGGGFASGQGGGFASGEGGGFAPGEGGGFAAGQSGFAAPQGGVSVGPRAAGASVGGYIAAALLAAGVVLGVIGLFPGYLAGVSLAQQSPELIPHVIYLAAWSAAAVLIALGGTRLRLGALLGAGLSLVTFGLFFADAGTAMAGGLHLADAGLVLGIAGWLACAAGSAVAMLIPSAGRPGVLTKPSGNRGALGRPRGSQVGAAVLLVLAGLGAAIAFAPSWDSFTLRTAAGVSQTLTAGNAFDNPGPVIAGDVAVMVALAAVVIAAAMWRPARQGAFLVAGATIPMVAQAISALVQVSEAATPAQFGITPAQAQRLGLTISSGLTPWFWIYGAFVLALVVSCAWMLFTPQQSAGVPAGPHAGAPPQDDLWRAAQPEPDDGIWDSAADHVDEAWPGAQAEPVEDARPGAQAESGADTWAGPQAESDDGAWRVPPADAFDMAGTRSPESAAADDTEGTAASTGTPADERTEPAVATNPPSALG
jgi:hypothetical protein